MLLMDGRGDWVSDHKLLSEEPQDTHFKGAAGKRNWDCGRIGRISSHGLTFAAFET